MDISEITSTDLPELAELYQQLLPNTRSIERMEAVLTSNRNNSNHVVLVAKDNGKLVGSLFGSCCEMLFGDCKSFMVLEVIS